MGRMPGIVLISYCKLVQILGLGLSQQRVVGTKIVVDGAVEDHKENDGEERLCSFRSSIPANIFYSVCLSRVRTV